MINDELTEKIIGAAFEVSNTLGCGFLEKVYENAMRINLQKKGFSVEQQFPIKVYYDNQVVGEYIADLFIEGKIIVELKVVKEIDDVHKAQVINYLRATGVKTGLLLNFGKSKLEFRRFDNKF